MLTSEHIAPRVPGLMHMEVLVVYPHLGPRLRITRNAEIRMAEHELTFPEIQRIRQNPEYTFEPKGQPGRKWYQGVASDGRMFRILIDERDQVAGNWPIVEIYQHTPGG